MFSAKMVSKLADHIKSLADRFHGVSLLKCHQLAYKFAASNKRKIPSNWERDRKDRWLGCKKKNNLTFRHLEATSLTRANAFNRPEVEQFFNNWYNV